MAHKNTTINDVANNKSFKVLRSTCECICPAGGGGEGKLLGSRVGGWWMWVTMMMISYHSSSYMA